MCVCMCVCVRACVCVCVCVWHSAMHKELVLMPCILHAHEAGALHEQDHVCTYCCHILLQQQEVQRCSLSCTACQCPVIYAWAIERCQSQHLYHHHQSLTKQCALLFDTLTPHQKPASALDRLYVTSLSGYSVSCDDHCVKVLVQLETLKQCCCQPCLECCVNAKGPLLDSLRTFLCC